MKRLVLAVALTIGLGCAAGPAAAQQLLPAEQADRANQNTVVATEAMTRAMGLLTGLSEGGGRLAAATTREELLAAVEAQSASVQAARAELRGLREQVARLRPVGGPDAPGSLQIADLTVQNVAHLMGQVDELLVQIGDMGAALQAGDQARLDKALAALSGGVVLVLEYQGEAMRTGMRFTPTDSPDHALSDAMACYYDGAAAYYRGMLKLGPRDQAASAVGAASQCITTARARAGAAFDRQKANPPSDARERAFMAQLHPLSDARLQVLSDAPAILDGVRVELLNPAVKAPGPETQAALVSIENRLMEIQDREVAIYAAQ